ncbi:hypothetical protein JOB18_037298 [Solea senegalensis]|uniref:Uncharacterized protein n=1 Tax=Solea senegalensis TaxID=28829 RepID=A0AAV6Q7L3_SOLSE|nr:hypothetical protein JOB18_037298 [Solea senegalensis]
MSSFHQRLLVKWSDTIEVGDSLRELATAVSTTIHGPPVETVKEHRYLGTFSDDHLSSSSNTEVILKKCHRTMCRLRKLNSFSVSNKVLLTFFYTYNLGSSQYSQGVFQDHWTSQSTSSRFTDWLPGSSITRPTLFFTQAAVSGLQDPEEESDLCSPGSSPCELSDTQASV